MDFKNTKVGDKIQVGDFEGVVIDKGTVGGDNNEAEADDELPEEEYLEVTKVAGRTHTDNKYPCKPSASATRVGNEIRIRVDDVNNLSFWLEVVVKLDD